MGHNMLTQKIIKRGLSSRRKCAEFILVRCVQKNRGTGLNRKDFYVFQ